MIKKILHISNSIKGGGAEVVCRDSLRILKENDRLRKHILFTNDSKGFLDLVDYSFGKKDRNSLGLIYSKSNKSKLYDLLLKESPDLIHLHHYSNLSPSILHAILKYKKRNKLVKIIHTVHSFEYVCSHFAAYDYKKNKRCLDCQKNKFKVKIFFRRCSRLGLFHSFAKGITNLLSTFFLNKKIIDFWTTPSFFLESKMLNNPLIEPYEIRVVRNPVIYNIKQLEYSDLKESKTFNFVYFGRLSEEKDLICIIKAFKLFHSHYNTVKLYLVGEGEMENILRNLVDELNINKFVEFTGYLDSSDLVSVLKTCKVSLLTSKCFENAPMVVLESILNNIFPIVCNHGGMKEMVDSTGVGSLFESNNHKDLFLKMKEVFNNYDENIFHLKEKRSTSLQDFSEKIYFSKISKIYDEMLSTDC